MKLALTYDDVALVPQYNNIESRTEPDLSTWLTKNIRVNLPIVPANMDSVIGPELANIIIDNGGIPILHRFYKEGELERDLDKIKNQVFISWGLKDLNKLKDICYHDKVIGVCFDIAHGHCLNMIEAIKFIKNSNPHIEVIAGNVCTTLGYQDLVSAGADAVKVGVGPGAACTTRIVTGFGIPQFSAVYEIGQVAKKLGVPIIADGGIRGSRDVLLALAAGSSSAMMGKLFACTEESAAKKRVKFYEFPPDDLNLPTHEACYRGQASEQFQQEFYGKVKSGTVAEGEQFWAPVVGKVQNIIDNLLGGIRSGFTYGGARSIKELQRKAEFVQVTPNYGTESHIRIS